MATNLTTSLDELKGGFEDALDRLLGGHKAVCPRCGKITHLVKNTDILAPHVYIPDEATLDFSNGIDFDVIKDCPMSGKSVRIIQEV